MENNSEDFYQMFYNFYDKNRLIANFGSLLMFVILMFNGIIQTVFINSLVFIYLVYKSIGALVSECKERITFMLKWWVCYGCYCSLEWLTDVFFMYAPFAFFYHCGKLVLYCWLITDPHYVEQVYCGTILPYYHKYKTVLDNCCEQAEIYVCSYGNKAVTCYGSCKKDTVKYCKRKIIELMTDLE